MSYVRIILKNILYEWTMKCFFNLFNDFKTSLKLFFIFSQKKELEKDEMFYNKIIIHYIINHYKI